MVDYFSKWVEFVPLRKASAQAITKAFVDSFISRYGTPLQVVSDNGPQFVSQIFRQLCQQLDIKHIKTVPYRPQSNQAERVNRNLVQMISAYVGNCHNAWDRYLSHFAFALRTAEHESTGKTPAELFLGRKILTPFQRLVTTENDRDPRRAEKLQEIIAEARQKIKQAQKKQEHYYNMRRREMAIKVGDYILLQNHQLSSAPNKVVGKFFPKYVGPFRVLAVKGNNIEIEKEGRKMPVNLDQVRVYKFREDSFSSHYSSDTEPETGSSQTTLRPGARKKDSDESTRTIQEQEKDHDDPPPSGSNARTANQLRKQSPKQQSPAAPRVTKRSPPTTTTGSRPPAKRQQQEWTRQEKRPPPTSSSDSRPRRKKAPPIWRTGERRQAPTTSSGRRQVRKKQAPPRKDRQCPGDKHRQTDTSMSGRPTKKRQPQQWQQQHHYYTRSKEQQTAGEPRRQRHLFSPDAERKMMEWCWKRKEGTKATPSLSRTSASSTL